MEASATSSTRGITTSPQDAAISSTMAHRDAASSLHPAMPLSPSSAVVFEPEDADKLHWYTLFQPWLEVFTTGSASFSLVDDWRPDGSQYKRSGVVVTLWMDVSVAVLVSDTKLQLCREAIDIALLLLAVKPSVIRRVLLRETEPGEQVVWHKYATELSAMARGVPVEMRLHLTASGFQTRLLQTQLLGHFTTHRDESISKKKPFQTRRQELLDRLFRRPATLKRFAHQAAHSPVRTVLAVDTMETRDVDEVASKTAMEGLHAFVADLELYQRRKVTRKWNIVTRHAPFRVEKIELRLRRLHITPHVVESTKKLMAVGVPVDLSRLNLDFRLIACSVEDLHAFVAAITTGATELIVDTGTILDNEHDVAADLDGQDRRERIRMVLKAIAAIPNLHCVNMAEILKLCTTPLNSEVVWRGLFEGILSRDQPLELLIFRNDVIFTEEDGVQIRQCTQRWRSENPDKKLRVGHLEFHVQNSDIDAVRALLSVFDDMEEFSLSIHFDDGIPDEFVPIDVVSILCFPSLRRLKLFGVDVPTMDLFDPNIPHPELPKKPTLREIDLAWVETEDPESLPRFLYKLRHTQEGTSELARTLRVLRVAQYGYARPALFNCDTLGVVDEMLSTNNTLADLALTVSCEDKKALKFTQQMLAKHRRRAVVSENVSAIDKARNIAFLSTIGSRAVGSRAHLDSTLVNQIFAFSAAHEERTISVQPW